MTERLSSSELASRVRRAVARVDREGARGITLLSIEEIEAMALWIALTGLPKNQKGDDK